MGTQNVHGRLPPEWLERIYNGTYSRYGFIVGEFPSHGLTAGRTDQRTVSDLVGQEERLSLGEKTRVRAFLTWWKH